MREALRELPTSPTLNPGAYMAGVFSTGRHRFPNQPYPRLPNHYRAGNLITRPLPCILSAATVTINQIRFCPPPPTPDKYHPSLLHGECYTSWNRDLLTWNITFNSLYSYGGLRERTASGIVVRMAGPVLTKHFRSPLTFLLTFVSGTKVVYSYSLCFNDFSEGPWS